MGSLLVASLFAGIFASGPAFASPAAKTPRIFVSNGGTGTIAEYGLQSQTLVESSRPLGFTYGYDGNVVISPTGAAWILPGTYRFYKLREASGGVLTTNDFDSFHPISGPIAIDVQGYLYAIDLKLRSVVEFGEYDGGRNHHGLEFAGGGIGKSAGLPTHVAVDSAYDIWATADNATVTEFQPITQGPVQTWQFPTGTTFTDAYSDAAGTTWVLYQSPSPLYFPDSTACTPVQNGPVTRYPIATHYVNGSPVATLYGPANENPSTAHVVADSTGRAYVSSSHQIFDYDPGTQCPNDNVTIALNEKGVLPPMAAYGGNLYVADPVANAIDAFAGGTTTMLWQIVQPSGQSGPVGIQVQ